MGFLSKTWNKFHIGIFVDACRHGDERQALSMLQSEPEIAYVKDKRGVSALFLAVSNGNNAIVEAILDITNRVFPVSVGSRPARNMRELSGAAEKETGLISD